MSEISCIHLSIVMILVSLLFNVLRVNIPKPLFRELGWGALFFSMLSLIGALFIRSETADYFALSNMYESMLVLAILMHLGYLIFDRWFSIPAMGWPVSLMLLVAIVWDTSLSAEINPLQAALQSYWRAIHVPVIIASYAMFTLAFISSAVYLVKSALNKGEATGSGGSRPNTPAAASAGGPMLVQGHAEPLATGGILSRANQSSSAAADAIRGDSLSIYDELTYRCVAFGFPLLTIGIILGGMWANEAWGNYWSWDPKESMSLVTLLGYGVYLHLRVNGHSPKTLSWVSIVGFILMLITYFGVNIMGLGLHSYGKIG
jgi:cytochrome c-type biogenesis protein CcsB